MSPTTLIHAVQHAESFAHLMQLVDPSADEVNDTTASLEAIEALNEACCWSSLMPSAAAHHAREQYMRLLEGLQAVESHDH